MAGTITPKQAKSRPDEQRGTLAKNYRSKTIQRWSELDANGPMDVYTLPNLAEMIVKKGITPTTPGGGTTSRLWTYVPTMNADDLSSATAYFGDPNVQAFQFAYLMGEELTLSMDASGTDVCMQSVKGKGQFPAKTAPGSVPSQLNAPLLVPGDTDVYIDTATIGTTLITGEVKSCEITIPTGCTYKWLANGAAASTRNFTRIGRDKRAPKLKLEYELLNMTRYDLFAGSNGDTVVKVRIRFNGPIIEGSLRYYVEFDIYGTLDDPSWGTNQSSNRTLILNIEGEYDSTLGADYALRIQNDRTTL
jgi:hypothetical protein